MNVHLKLTINSGFSHSYGNSDLLFTSFQRGGFPTFSKCVEELEEYINTVSRLALLAQHLHTMSNDYAANSNADINTIIEAVKVNAKFCLNIPNDLYFKVTNYTKNKVSISFFMCTVTVQITK